MKVTFNWLKDYVDFDLTPSELSEKLTMLGFEVEDLYQTNRIFSKIIIGQVLSIEPHPDADKLTVCIVSTGESQYNVICGAPNVQKNKKYPFAQIGARIENFQIEKRKIRGVQSEGMLCSEAELGLTDRAAGLMELPQDAPVGQDFLTYLGDPDTVFDINITPNRPDCLSVIGLAREIAAATNGKLSKPAINFSEKKGDIDKLMQVAIKDVDKCYRYSGRYLENIKIKQSPFWLAERLENVGIRSINNVVDITNYVMMETGQPLHAFDYRFIEDQKIVVRTAADGEQFVTLDDKKHILDHEDLVICDGKRSVALAGVMGGQNSEVANDTEKVFLESAYFEPTGVRKTAHKLEISTESSKRFERGIDPNGTVYAMERAAKLLIDYADAQVVGEKIDACPRYVDEAKIELSVERTNRHLGTSIKKELICDILDKLECSCSEINEDRLTVVVPTFRIDLTRQADLFEEVARCYGYENIKPNFMPCINQLQENNQKDIYKDRIRHNLVGLGLNETVSLNLVLSKSAELFLQKNFHCVELLNPISKELAAFQTNILHSLLLSTAYNKNRQLANLRFFQIGNVAWKDSASNIYEETQIGLALAGNKIEQSWNEKETRFSYYDLKGIVEAFLLASDIVDYKFTNARELFWDFQSSGILLANEYVGAFGKLDKNICSAFKIKSDDVFATYLNFDAIYKNRRINKIYNPVPRFPSIPFDLALIVNENVKIADIETCIWSHAGPFLKKLRLFDFYKNDQLGPNKKSIAFSLTFSSKERTLSESEVDQAIKVILEKLWTNFGAELRPG